MKSASEKAVETLLPTPLDTITEPYEADWEVDIVQLCASCPTIILSMQSFLWYKIYSQIYTIMYLYMHIVSAFSATSEPLSPWQRPSPLWARNCTETEAKVSVQTDAHASDRRLSRAPTFFRWRLVLAVNYAQTGV